jgi:hypothetical protein
MGLMHALSIDHCAMLEKDRDITACYILDLIKKIASDLWFRIPACKLQGTL